MDGSQRGANTFSPEWIVPLECSKYIMEAPIDEILGGGWQH
jgi:hypothetical protein